MNIKNSLSVACLTIALTLNTLPASAYSNQKGIAGDVIKGILIEIGSDAARGLFRAMFSSNAAERNPAFTDNEYLISVGNNGGDFTYYGVNLKTKDSISLRGATVTGNNQRRVYSWRNSGYRYQVAWQPNDPGVVRLQVFTPGGKQILNRLLYKTNV